MAINNNSRFSVKKNKQQIGQEQGVVTAGIILGMGSANERRRYNVVPHWLSP